MFHHLCHWSHIISLLIVQTEKLGVLEVRKLVGFPVFENPTTPTPQVA
jgi:hypothetical protein